MTAYSKPTGQWKGTAMKDITRRGFVTMAAGAAAAAALTACTPGSGAGDETYATDAGASESATTTSSDDLYFTHQEVRESPAWVTALDATKDADQLIVVAGVGLTTAYVTMHEKDADGTWNQIIATPGFIGLQGLGEANWKETYTPIGTFTIDKAFGLAPDPGCQMEYTQCDGSYYWSGDYREGMHFNELVVIDDLPDLDLEESERIADYDYAYQYCLNMGYNAECIPEKGCAFFFHCFRVNRTYTGGCVAVPENIMRFIMQHVRDGCRITIDSLDSMGGDLDA